MNHLTPMSALVCFAACLLLSCGGATTQPAGQSSTSDSTAVVEKAPTADDQKNATPDAVLQILKQGNADFSSGKANVKDDTSRLKQTAGGQHPLAIILACIDSRVPVEAIFNRGIGDVFVTRVAGNIVDEDVLGSMEYACKEAGSKLIVVMGHESCGAVKAAIDDVKEGNITTLLSKIRPSVTSLSTFQGDKTSKNSAFVHAVSVQNVQHSVQAVRDGSAILKDMEQKGQIKIVGAVYNIATGKVEFVQ